MRFASVMTATLFGLVAAGSVQAQTAPQTRTLTLAADEWCPYNCAVGSGRPGYMVEIAERAFTKKGWKLEYVAMPWSRALAEAAAGRVDGVFGATRSEFKEGVFPQKPLGKSVNTLAALPASAVTYSGIESLKKLRVGAVKEYSYDEGTIDAYFASDEAKGRVELLSGADVQEQNLRKLLNGRIDAWLENLNVVLWTAAEMSPKPQLALTTIGEPSDVFIAFSPAAQNAAELAEIIDAETAELRKSGELAKILSKYNLVDWELIGGL